MNREAFITHIEQFYAKGINIIKAKNQDYAGGNNPFKNFEASIFVGVSPDRGMLIRIQDKLARISNLLDSEAAVKDESIEDTILDMANYIAILSAYLAQKKNHIPDAGKMVGVLETRWTHEQHPGASIETLKHADAGF